MLIKKIIITGNTKAPTPASAYGIDAWGLSKVMQVVLRLLVVVKISDECIWQNIVNEKTIKWIQATIVNATVKWKPNWNAQILRVKT